MLNIILTYVLQSDSLNYKNYNFFKIMFYINLIRKPILLIYVKRFTVYLIFDDDQEKV